MAYWSPKSCSTKKCYVFLLQIPFNMDPCSLGSFGFLPRSESGEFVNTEHVVLQPDLGSEIHEVSVVSDGRRDDWGIPWLHRLCDDSIPVLSLGVEMGWQWRRMAVRCPCRRVEHLSFIISGVSIYVAVCDGHACILVCFCVDETWQVIKPCFSLTAGLRGTISSAGAGGGGLGGQCMLHIFFSHFFASFRSSLG